MASFEVPYVRINSIEPMPNADNLELAVINDFRSVVPKGVFKPGMPVAYIPEGAIVPAGLVDHMDLTGKLSGAARNRVKAIKIRGQLSQGLILDVLTAPRELIEWIGNFATEVQIGCNLAEALGISKFQPEIPRSMAGNVAYIEGAAIAFDVENFKRHPHLLIEGEMVEFTEKTHGTFAAFGIVKNLHHPEMFDGDGIVYSKGLGARNLVFKNEPANDRNLYVATAKRLEIHRKLRSLFPNRNVQLFGEIYGKGVQDLTYGKTQPDFATFDLMLDGVFLSPDEAKRFISYMGISYMPVLYRGPFSKEIMLKHTDGKTVIGNQSHIREGIVIRTVNNFLNPIVLKSVSADYLLRKGEVTEYA